MTWMRRMVTAGMVLCAAPALAGPPTATNAPAADPPSVSPRPERATSATVTVDEKNFDSTVAKKAGIVFVDWWAPWCAACRVFGPVYEKVAARHPDATFAKIDADEEQGLFHDLRIESIPTLMVVRDGVIVATRIGPLDESELETLLARGRALDMGKVRVRARAQERDSDQL